MAKDFPTLHYQEWPKHTYPRKNGKLTLHVVNVCQWLRFDGSVEPIIHVDLNCYGQSNLVDLYLLY